MISQAIIKIQCKKLLLQEKFKLNFQRNAKRKIEFHKQALSTLRRILLYSYLLATGHIYFLPLPMSHWKMMNIYCTFLNTDTHKYKVTSPGSGLISLGGNQGNETVRTNPTSQ